MDFADRIARRRSRGRDRGLVSEWDPLNPAAHLEAPVGRGPTLESLLDAIDPVFDGHLPPDVYVHGPAGAGKSALVSATIAEIDDQISPSRPAIHTTTRAASESDGFEFAYVDARNASSEFRLYHTLLDELVSESVPRRGVGTDDLRARLDAQLDKPGRGMLVAVDHVGESGTLSVGEFRELLVPFSSALAWIAVGRVPPEDVRGGAPSATTAVAGYRQHSLSDVLSTRASMALSGGVTHEQVRSLASWAAGDAHDGLAALYGAAVLADQDDAGTIRDEDIEAGMEAVPRGGVPLARILALPGNRQVVLATLLEVTDDGDTIEEAATAIAADTDLSQGTVKRFLYELSEAGILCRVRVEVETNGSGRQPSRVEPRFPTLVFRDLIDRA